MSQAHAPFLSDNLLVTCDDRALPLRGAALRVDARGGMARTVLEQRFHNPHAETLAVTYRMPLPADGAVSGYAFIVGDRRITGEVDRRAAARERFEQAIVEGRRAALLEQERSSLFTHQIHGILPGAEIVAEIVVDQRLAWLADEGAWEWRFPTAAAPRYLGGVADPGPFALDVADAPLPARFSLALAIRDALPWGKRPESPSHPLTSSLVAGSRRVALASGDAPLDRDVVVRWAVPRPAAGVTLDLARPAAPLGRDAEDAAYALVTLVPPQPSHRPAPVPRDLVLLLDRSGSMTGAPLVQAQRVCAALVDGLGGEDTLEVLAFDSVVERFRPASERATAETRREALAWIASRPARGGTEMRAGIVEALAAVRPDAQRQVVVVSDGLMGSEQETVADILARLPPASRLSTVGIGSSVNRSFTAAAARAGRGVEVVVGLGEDAERAAQRLLARTVAPLVVDVAIEGDALLDCAPRRLPDLFAGAPLLAGARVRAGGGELVVRGRTADGGWEKRVRVPPTPAGTGAPGVVALFGREAVEDAEMRLAAGEAAATVDPIVDHLGLDFQIATRLTSWVAVETEPALGPEAPRRTARVPQQLPHGLSAAGLGLRAPAAAGAGPIEEVPRQRLESPLRSPARPTRRDSVKMRALYDLDEKTRATQCIAPPRPAPVSNDGLVVLHSPEPALIGRRFDLEVSPFGIGRGAANHVVLDDASASRRHAHLERRDGVWFLVDDGSTNRTRHCEETGGSAILDYPPVVAPVELRPEHRIWIGRTIFEFLSGYDVEEQYQEAVRRTSHQDGLLMIDTEPFFLQELRIAIADARRRRGRRFGLALFEIDDLARTRGAHGLLWCDELLRQVAGIARDRVRGLDSFLGRRSGEGLAAACFDSSCSGSADACAEHVRERVADHVFELRDERTRATISAGVTLFQDGDREPDDLFARAAERLRAAKEAGGNRVCS